MTCSQGGRPRRVAIALCAAALLLLGSPAAAGPVRGADPTRSGGLPVDEIDYRGGFVVLQDEFGATIVEELKGTIHLPDTRGGPWPLIVFIHGRHATCRVADRIEVIFAAWPCPEARPVTSDVASYRGYDYLAHNLASHGYVVASVSANAINSYDFPVSLFDSGMHWRARLVMETLDALYEWNREPGPREVERRLIGKLDFDRIGLMGHSRGGEGVARFVRLNRNGAGFAYPGLKAVFALAPTDFYREQVPGVHFGTIVPLCDGDVFNLQGAWMFDDARFVKPRGHARVQFAVTGANHNFFNTVWTGDDGAFAGDGSGSNPACNPERRSNVRLSAHEQRQVGLGLMAGFFRRYVGGEQAFDPLMTGASNLSTRACGRPCDRVVLTSYVGPQSSMRLLVEPPEERTRYHLRGNIEMSLCQPSVNTGQGCPSGPNRSIARQLTLTWEGDAAWRVPLAPPADVRRFRALTFRTAVNFSQPHNDRGREQDFSLVLVDAAGRRAQVRAARYGDALRPPAGPRNQQIVLNGVRIPLAHFGSVDLGRIVAVELRFGAGPRTGSIQFAELAFQERR